LRANRPCHWLEFISKPLVALVGAAQPAIKIIAKASAIHGSRRRRWAM